MSAEGNKSLVRREQEELWNHSGDLDAAEELFADGEAAKQQAADFRRGFGCDKHHRGPHSRGG